jgi:hypothetical protein
VTGNTDGKKPENMSGLREKENTSVDKQLKVNVFTIKTRIL